MSSVLAHGVGMGDKVYNQLPPETYRKPVAHLVSALGSYSRRLWHVGYSPTEGFFFSFLLQRFTLVVSQRKYSKWLSCHPKVFFSPLIALICHYVSGPYVASAAAAAGLPSFRTGYWRCIQ